MIPSSIELPGFVSHFSMIFVALFSLVGLLRNNSQRFQNSERIEVSISRSLTHFSFFALQKPVFINIQRRFNLGFRVAAELPIVTFCSFLRNERFFINEGYMLQILTVRCAPSLYSNSREHFKIALLFYFLKFVRRSSFRSFRICHLHFISSEWTN